MSGKPMHIAELRTTLNFCEKLLCHKNLELFGSYVHTVETAFSRLKGQMVCEMTVAKTSPCKANTFFSSKSKQKTPSIVPAVYIDILYLCCSKFSLHKRWFQAYTSLQQSSCVLYQEHYVLLTLLWSHTQVRVHVNRSVLHNRDFSVQSSMHGILVIKSRRSQTTELVKSSFNCTQFTHS